MRIPAAFDPGRLLGMALEAIDHADTEAPAQAGRARHRIAVGIVAKALDLAVVLPPPFELVDGPAFRLLIGAVVEFAYQLRARRRGRGGDGPVHHEPDDLARSPAEGDRGGGTFGEGVGSRRDSEPSVEDLGLQRGPTDVDGLGVVSEPVDETASGGPRVGGETADE